jgi:hypothetical protein
MGLTDDFADAVAFASQIDFDIAKASPTDISVFESTIRYVGGLLSAYQLSGAQYPALVDKAEQLASRMVDIAFSKVRRLSGAYVLACCLLSTVCYQGNVIPYGHVDFSSSTPIIDDVSGFYALLGVFANGFLW